MFGWAGFSGQQSALGRELGKGKGLVALTSVGESMSQTFPLRHGIVLNFKVSVPGK